MADRKQYAVLGLGRFGRSIVTTLAESGCDVLACDKDMDLVEEMSQFATHAVQADVTDEVEMEALGLGNFDVVVIAIGSHMESCVMATMIAKQYGAKEVIAKAPNQLQKRILEKVGADRVVLPEWEMGAKIAAGLITSNLIDFISLSDEYGVAELEPLPQWVGLPLNKSNIRAESGITIVAIKRGNRIIVSPRPDEIINATDIVVALGENKNIQGLNATHKPRGGFFQSKKHENKK